jgi:hypothetical protein
MHNLELSALSFQKHKYLILFLIILIVGPLLVWYIYNLEFSFGNENDQERVIEEEIPMEEVTIVRDQFENIKQLHWNHMPLKYKIINLQDCGGDEVKEARKAFELVQNQTDNLVRFEETEGESDIKLECVKGGIPKEMEGKRECENFTFDHYKTQLSVYTEGLLSRFSQKLVSTKLINRSEKITVYQICWEWGNFNPMMVLAEEQMPEISDDEINEGYINLYLYGEGVRCAHFPAREVHEILHNLGIAHPVSNRLADKIFEALQKGLYLDISREEATEITKDAMFTYFNCALQTKIQEKYISCLKYIYSNGKIEGDCSKVKFLNS